MQLGFVDLICYAMKVLSCCLKALQGLIQGAGQAYQPYFSEEVRQQLWQCLYHPNRFVRETGYETTGDLCAIFAGAPLHSWGKDLALKLQDGLSENWSQVLSCSALWSRPDVAYGHLGLC